MEDDIGQLDRNMLVINKVYNGNAWVVSNPALTERTLYNYSPLALPAGVATEFVAADKARKKKK